MNSIRRNERIVSGIVVSVFSLLLPLTDGCVRERSMLSLNQTTGAGPCTIKPTQFTLESTDFEITAKGGSFKLTRTIKYGEQILDVGNFHCQFTIFKPDAGEPTSLEYVILQK